MKKTDIALIIIIISVSAGLSYWIANITIGQSNEEPIVVRTVEKIGADEVSVSESVFAENGINPTVEAIISGEDLTSFIDEDPEAETANAEASAANENTTTQGETDAPSDQLLFGD